MVVVEGGDLAAVGDFRKSGMLVRLVSSWLNTESNDVGIEELAVAEDEVAGLEKLVGAALATLEAPDGSFKVCARFDTSIDRIGSGGITGMLVSGDSGLLPEGLSVAALLAARWAYVSRSAPRPLTLPPLRYVVLVDLFNFGAGTEGRKMSPVSSSDDGSKLGRDRAGVFATRLSSSSKLGS